MSELQTTTLRPDAKGRITLGALAYGISSFRVSTQEDGRIILEPYKEIPAREAWLFENKRALKQVQKGLQDAAAGEISKGADFSQYLNEETD
jgi:hypothetical protein